MIVARFIPDIWICDVTNVQCMVVCGWNLVLPLCQKFSAFIPQSSEKHKLKWKCVIVVLCIYVWISLLYYYVAQATSQCFFFILLSRIAISPLYVLYKASRTSSFASKEIRGLIILMWHCPIWLVTINQAAWKYKVSLIACKYSVGTKREKCETGKKVNKIHYLSYFQQNSKN